MRFVAFDQEEIGLVGSKFYVKEEIEDKNKIIGNINLEMMGTNSRGDSAFHIIDCEREDSVFMTKEILNKIKTLGLPLVHVPGCTGRSDHGSFWKAGIGAVVLSENFFGGDSDDCYHRSCDVVDSRLNFTYMKNISLAALATVIEILGVAK